MRRAVPVFTLALLLALGALGGAGCRGYLKEEPPIHLNPNMDQQRRLDPQQDHAFFEDGRASRLPVPGTQRWGSFTDEHLMDGRVDGAFARQMPADVPLSRHLLSRGQDRFRIYCTPCHDSAGTGSGPVVLANKGMLKPPSLHEDRLRAMPIGQLYDVIRNGARNMPPYGPQVPVEDRWAIAAYVRALQVSQAASLEQVPGEIRVEHGWEAPPAEEAAGARAAPAATGEDAPRRPRR